MEKDVVIAIPTIGAYAPYTVDAALTTMKLYTDYKFRYVVSLDHSPQEIVDEVKAVCNKYKVELFINPHPVGDMSTNINNIFNNTDEEWVFLFDDGMLAQEDWAEPAMKVVREYGNYEFTTPKGKAPLGVIGIISQVAHNFQIAGIVKTRYSTEDWQLKWGPRTSYPAYYDIINEWFQRWPEWWTGHITWRDLYNGFKQWYLDHPNWQDEYDFDKFGQTQTQFPHINPDSDQYSGLRHSILGISPQGFYRRQLWKDMGGFYPGFTYFEGYADIKSRLFLNYVNVMIPGSPYIHLPSIGTTNRADMNLGNIHLDNLKACVDIFGFSIPEAYRRINDLNTPELREEVNSTIDVLLKDVFEKWH